MRLVSVTVLFCLFFNFSRADFEPQFIFKGTVLTNTNQSVSGYFGLPGVYVAFYEGKFSYNDGGKEMYLRITVDSSRSAWLVKKTEYHFFNYCKRVSENDIQIFKSMFIINTSPSRSAATLTPYLLNPSIKVVASQIKEIVVDEVYCLPPLTHFVTELNEYDFTWINRDSANYHLPIGGPDMCDYDALYYGKDEKLFNEEASRVKRLYEQLRALESSENYNEHQHKKLSDKILSEINRLKKLKIVVAGYCSC
jgi:hypothetical protein